YIEDDKYYFYLTDHLGNNRVVVDEDGNVVQQNDYYPFGMAFADNENEEVQPYKYNGKELDRKHGLNWYDYSARYYDSTVPRFTTVDPLAEKYYSISPYVYCLNNPLKFIDPDGKEAKEKPIKLFSPKDDSKFSKSADNFKYKTGDNIFYVFAHGSTGSLAYYDGEKTQSATNPKKINEILSEKSPEWKNAMEQNQEITLILYVCDTGNEDLNSNPIAKRISEEYENVTVYGANGYSTTIDLGPFGAYEIGIQPVNKEGKTNEGTGAFNIYQKGQNIGTKEFDYPKIGYILDALFGEEKKKNKNEK
ncbi:RHS repeat domain-containing protein, partial [Dysgonomonas sp. 511]|uniref:RHS repeat domain-containing protein n=1 Tax=Dysgonomonas sp. 511 TaxID=2302930 RepID=UPI0027144CC7